MNSFGRRFWLTAILCGLLVGTSLSCGKQDEVSKDLDAEDAAGLPANVKTGVKPQADSEVAVFEVNDYGRIVIELYPNIAPKMVERFKKLIGEHFYDGMTFHRIDPQLGIIQGGDPLSKDNDPANDGTGDSSYPNVPGEFSDLPYERGTVGAARKGQGPGMTEKQAFDTANCQFFVTLKQQPAFDKKYTVFGRVIDGIKNAEIIMGAPVKEGTERPDPPIVVRSVTLQPRASFPQ
jgi:peptidylprolyl isomerase